MRNIIAILGYVRPLSIASGHLRLDLPRDVYERTGLQGKPIEDGVRKHVLARYGRFSGFDGRHYC